MSYLNIKDIAAIKKHKKTRQNESFEVILDNCFKQIKKRVELFPNENVMFFDVPDFMLGYPLYKLEDCLHYIIAKLKDNGYKVQYIFPRILCISWNIPETSDKLLEDQSVSLKNNTSSTTKTKRVNAKTRINTNKSGKFILNLT
jgi:hypothetical protein